MYISNFLYPVTHWWTFGLSLPFSYCGQWCCEHSCTSIFFEYLFSVFQGVSLGMEFLDCMLILCLTLYIYVYNLFIFYWRRIALQNFIVFCQTSIWISHRYTFIPSLLNLPPITPPFHPYVLLFEEPSLFLLTQCSDTITLLMMPCLAAP